MRNYELTRLTFYTKNTAGIVDKQLGFAPYMIQISPSSFLRYNKEKRCEGINEYPEIINEIDEQIRAELFGYDGINNLADQKWIEIL